MNQLFIWKIRALIDARIDLLKTASCAELGKLEDEIGRLWSLMETFQQNAFAEGDLEILDLDALINSVLTFKIWGSYCVQGVYPFSDTRLANNLPFFS